MKNTVHLGFIAVIFIMTILAYVGLGQIKKSNEEILDLIEQYDLKIKYAHSMSNATRFRQISLLSMLVIKDPFALEDEILKFYSYALPYRNARQALFSLPMSNEEKAIHNLLDKQTSISQPLGNRAVDMFRDGESREKIIEVILLSKKYQTKLFNTIDRFVALQKKRDENAVNVSRQQFDDLIFWISYVGIIALIISVYISRYVGKAVAEKNQQLMDAGDDMAKAYIRAEEATIIKSEFLATMSHEIRTPLTAIIGFAETSLFEEQTPEQRQTATQTIIRSGKHLLNIINDILDLSKIEANKLEIEYVELSLFELLADIKNLVSPAAEEKGLGFSINYIFPLPENIMSDPLRIKQILINLCNNAIKFTEKGYVLINVSCDQSENRLNFEVVDSGVGIPEDKHEIIFKAYKQADTSTTRQFGGTGLGLSLSQQLANCLGGTLSLTSEPGKGSQFTLSLSYESLPGSGIVFDKEHVPENYEMSERVKASGYLSGRILLAEDNADNQELLLFYLSRMGLDVSIVGNGLLAVEAVRENNFDIILMDIRMPVMDGLEATRLIRKEGFDKPIIALTANAMKADKQACLKQGCSDFLSKPIDANLLSETLAKYLANTNHSNR